MAQATITPEEVLAMEKPAEGFLCPLSANTYGVEFCEFEIRDYDSGKSIFKVVKDPDQPPMQLSDDIDPALEKQIRTIRYTFPVEFLKWKTVRTSLVFSVGPEPMQDFRMIERHYFQDTLLRSYDFSFGFCIPNSTNSWESIYPVPDLSNEDIVKMVGAPYASRSDSFYFCGDKLIMHNKAEYSYSG
mmetsp:Transcript_18684/g.60971  ORF Transcript_18684/g.60971 Transcript_18684/m.60971 type:complete len:187 (+) Transcript_18684:978-1538(+)